MGPARAGSSDDDGSAAVGPTPDDEPNSGDLPAVERSYWKLGTIVAVALGLIGLVADLFGIRSGVQDLFSPPQSPSVVSEAAPTVHNDDAIGQVPKFEGEIEDFEAGARFETFLRENEYQTVFISASIADDVPLGAQNGEFDRLGGNDSPYLYFYTSCPPAQRSDPGPDCEGAEVHLVGPEVVGKGGIQINFGGSTGYRLRGFFSVVLITGPQMNFMIYNLEPLSPLEAQS